jgi:hypothetical protein
MNQPMARLNVAVNDVVPVQLPDNLGHAERQFQKQRHVNRVGLQKTWQRLAAIIFQDQRQPVTERFQCQRAHNAFKRQVLRRLTFVPQARQLFQRRIFVVQHLDDNRRAIIPTAAINRNVTVAVNLVGQLITRHCGHKSVLHCPNIRPIMTYRAAFQEIARFRCASSTRYYAYTLNRVNNL